MRGRMPIFWTDAQTSYNLKKDLASFRPLLNIPASNNLEIDLQVDAVLANLQDFGTPWLMVFDNYDDPKTFNNIDYFMPSCSHGIILITTRHEDTLKLADFPMNLPSLLDVDAINLLEVTSTQTDYNENDRAIKTDIVNRLGNHALAIAQAGSYIQDSKISFRDFLDVFERRKERIVGDKSDGMNEYRKRLSNNTEVETSMNVFATFDLSYRQLIDREDKISDYSADILTLLAFFDSKSVSERLMESYCTHDDAQIDIVDSTATPDTSSESQNDASARRTLKPGIFLTHHAEAWDPGHYSDVLIQLSKLSLTQPFTRHDNNLCSVSLHPLVRDWIRIRTSNINSQQYTTLAGTCIYRLLDQTEDPNGYFYILNLPESQELQAHLDIHATDRSLLFGMGSVLEYKIPGEHTGQPELLFGRLAYDNGMYEKAVWWFKLSVEQRIKAFGTLYSNISQ